MGVVAVFECLEFAEEEGGELVALGEGLEDGGELGGGEDFEEELGHAEGVEGFHFVEVCVCVCVCVCVGG